MGLAQISVNVTLDTTECCACGIQFAAPDWFIRARRADKQSFYCPNGHSLSWRESEADRLKRELAAEKERHQRTLARENEVIAERAKLERKLKRVHAGVCPCCNRTFQNLARHMETQHPERLKDAAPRLPADPPPPKTKGKRARHVDQRLAEIKNGK